MSKIDWLILAEKASQANAIADAIFDKGKPRGSLVDGGLGGQNLSSLFKGEVRIARFQGHLYELLMPQEQDPKYSRKQEVILDDWGLPVGGGWMSAKEMLSVYPIELDTYKDSFKFKPISANHKKMAKNIEKLFKRADRVIISTDVDPEGEMIFLNWYKNTFGSYDGYNKKKLYRVNPANNDPVSIRKMFKTSLQNYDDFKGDLGNVYKSLAPRGYARSIADYEYGLTYSLLGEIAQNELIDGQKEPIRGAWGRLKNTILGRVYQIEKDYDDFVPTSSYRVDMKLSSGHILKGVDSLVFSSKELGEKFLKESSLPSKVSISIISDEKSTKPPALFSRTEVLKASGKKNPNVNWSSVLQSLYEHHKILSYPRTDSRHIGEIEFQDLKSYVNSPFIKSLLDERVKSLDSNSSFSFYDRPSDKKWVDDSKITPHFAIVPNFEVSLGDTLYNQLSNDEKTMFLLDLYQSASLCMPDSVIKSYKVSALPDVDGVPLFKGSFKKSIEQGWRLLIGNLEKDELPPEKGDYDVTYVLTEVPKKRPQLVDLYELVDILKKNNEGTSATRDSTIESMIKSNALIVEKKGKKLRVNPALKPVVGYLLDRNWIQMSKTAEWQKALDEIKTKEEALSFIEQVRKSTYELQEDFRKHFNISIQ